MHDSGKIANGFSGFGKTFSKLGEIATMELIKAQLEKTRLGRTTIDPPTESESIPSSPASTATIVEDERDMVIPRRRKNPHPMRSPDKVEDHEAVYCKCVVYEIYETDPLALLDRQDYARPLHTGPTTRSAKKRRFG